MSTGWELVELIDIDENGATATGDLQHSDMIDVIARKTAGLTGRRVAGVHLEDDELGELISVHLEAEPSRSVGRELSDPGPPEGSRRHCREIQTSGRRMGGRYQRDAVLLFLLGGIGQRQTAHVHESHCRPTARNVVWP